jgi:NADH dehydrogenase
MRARQSEIWNIDLQRRQQMILVAGSTGILGSEIVRQLREQNTPVRALVRTTSDRAKVDQLKALGAAIVEGDLTDPASLDPICRGVETVITTVTVTASRNPNDTIAGVDQAGGINLVNAANKADVPHFIYTSFSTDSKYVNPLTTAKRTVEKHVKQSGMDYTILRPTYFMEIWLAPFLGFDYGNHKVTLYGDGKNPISWISFVDVARFAVLAVDSPAARNTILELGGPDKLSPNEVVRIFEERSGKPFQVEYVPVEALQAQYASAQEPLPQSFAALMLAYAAGDPIDMEQMLKLFPMKLTSVRDYAARVMAVAA